MGVSKLLLAGGALVVLLATAPPAQAGTLFTVTLNTATLEASPAPGYQLNFQLNGTGAPGDYNTTTIGGFTFGAAAAGDPASGLGAEDATFTYGDASESGDTVLLDDDNSFANSFTQFFTAGGSMSFAVDLSDVLEPGQTAPDQFTIALLDTSGNELPTTDPNGSLVTVDISSPNPGIQTFSTLSGGITATAAQPVPEPGTWVLLAFGLAGLAFTRRRLAEQT